MVAKGGDGVDAATIAGVGYLCIGLVDLAVLVALVDSGRLLAVMSALLFGVANAGLAVYLVRHDTKFRSSFDSKRLGDRNVIARLALGAFPLSLAGVGVLWWLFHRFSEEAGFAVDFGPFSAGGACGFFCGFGVTYIAAARVRARDEAT